jgi:hypothetical protein
MEGSTINEFSLYEVIKRKVDERVREREDKLRKFEAEMWELIKPQIYFETVQQRMTSEYIDQYRNPYEAACAEQYYHNHYMAAMMDNFTENPEASDPDHTEWNRVFDMIQSDIMQTKGEIRSLTEEITLEFRETNTIPQDRVGEIVIKARILYCQEASLKYHKYIKEIIARWSSDKPTWVILQTIVPLYQYRRSIIQGIERKMRRQPRIVINHILKGLDEVDRTGIEDFIEEDSV